MTEQPKVKSYKFRNLLFFLFLYLFGSPFLSPYPSLAILAHFSLSIALCFAVYAVQKEQNYRTIAMILLVPVLIVYWLAIYDLIYFSQSGSYILLIIFFSLLILSFVKQLALARKITINQIFATICLYLIIGLFWGTLYALMYEFNPASYVGALLEGPHKVTLSTFNYFSLVTLTTLGYGDITPQTPSAGALCQIEAVVGQIFTAVVIAWLVGNFVAEKRKSFED